MEELHRGDDAEEGSRLPVTDDKWLSEQQVGDIRGRQMVSRRRDDLWFPWEVAGEITSVDCHVWRFPAHGPTCWNERHQLRGWRTCRVRRWKRRDPEVENQWESVAGTSLVGYESPSNVELTWLGSCPTLVDPGKPREECWRTWCTRSCFMLSCYQKKGVLGTEKRRSEYSQHIQLCRQVLCWYNPGIRHLAG